jgi:hypothetical protein
MPARPQAATTSVSLERCHNAKGATAEAQPDFVFETRLQLLHALDPPKRVVWWRVNRSASPELFAGELGQAIATIELAGCWARHVLYGRRKSGPAPLIEPHTARMTAVS